jgi:hypothetical protein
MLSRTFESCRCCLTRSPCWVRQKQLCSGLKSGRVDSSCQEDNDRECNNCTRVLVWLSIQHNAWSFEVSESVQTVGAQRTEESRKMNQMGLSLQYPYGMQMKEKICLTGFLLQTNHGCITTNPNHSVFQCNGNKHPSSPSTKKFKVITSAGKVMLTVFWDSEGDC